MVEKGNRWYGQWYVRGRLVKRSLGPMRQPGSRDGLTRTQAEARLRELMLETDSAPPPVTERMTIAEVGDRRIKQLARSGRKPDTTLANYESEIRIHFTPFFGEKAVDEITTDEIEDFIDACVDAGARLDRGLAVLSVKTVRNLYVHLNGVFEFAVSKGWAYANPCRTVEKPASSEDDDSDIHFLDQAELDALQSRDYAGLPAYPGDSGAGGASQVAARYRAHGLATDRRAPRVQRSDCDLLVSRDA